MKNILRPIDQPTRLMHRTPTSRGFHLPAALGRFVMIALSCMSLSSVATAGENQNLETVAVGTEVKLTGNPNFPTGTNFVSFPLNAQTVITGAVDSSGPIDTLSFTLAPGKRLKSATLTVTNFNPVNSDSAGSFRVTFTGEDFYNDDLQKSAGYEDLSTEFAAFKAQPSSFSVEIRAPQSTGSTIYYARTVPPTYGSASYVVTIEIGDVAQPVASYAGSYLGLMNAEDSVNIISPSFQPPSPITNGDLSARFDMAVSATGAITGKMAWGNKVTSFTSRLVVVGGKASPYVNISIPSLKRTLALAILPTTGYETSTQQENSFDGLFGHLVATGSPPITNYDEQGSFRAWRNVWTPTSPPPASYSKYQTFAFKGRSKDEAPKGSSFGSIKASGTAGNYSTAGTLADGEKFLTSGFYSSTGETLIYQYLYARKRGGVVAGKTNKTNRDNFIQGPPAKFAEAANVIVITPNQSIGGYLNWIKRPVSGAPTRIILAAQTSAVTEKSAAGPYTRNPNPKPVKRPTAPTDPLYPNGFDIDSSLQGGAYTPPAAGAVLGISGSPQSGGGIISGFYFNPGNNDLNLNTITTIVITNPSSTGLTNRAIQQSLTTGMANFLFTQFDVATGLFSGTFRYTPPPARPVTFSGIFVYDDYVNGYIGRGFFIANGLTRSLPVSVSPRKYSGDIIIYSEFE